MNRIVQTLTIALVVLAASHLRITEPPAAWAIGGQPGLTIASEAKPLTPGELRKIEAFLRRMFGNPQIRLASQPPEAEVYLGKEYLGVVYPYEDRGERTFYFEMAIFEEDFEGESSVGSKR